MRASRPLGGAGIVSYRDGLPLDLDFQLGRQGAPQRLLVDVAVHGVDDRAEGSQLLQHRGGEEVAGVDDRLGGGDQLHAELGQPAGAPWHVGVGEDGDQASGLTRRWPG
jgi:hypothetical protein